MEEKAAFALASTPMTPYKIALLILIVTVGAFASSKSCYAHLMMLLMDSLVEAKNIIEPQFSDFWLSIEKELSNKVPSESIESFKKSYIQRLCGVDSIDAINDMILRLQMLLTSSLNDDIIIIEKHSVYGLSIRKCKLAWEYLSFHETGEIYKEYKKYIEAGIKDLNEGKGSGMILNIDKAINDDINTIERERGCELANSLRDLRTIFDPKPGMEPRHLYLAFIRAMKHRNYEQSIEALHRLFDYYLVNVGHGLYQYALFYLALVHYDFDSLSEALYTIKECISIAREAVDELCLGQALKWKQVINGYQTDNKEVKENRHSDGQEMQRHIQWNQELLQIDNLLSNGQFETGYDALIQKLNSNATNLEKIDCLVRITAIDMKSSSKMKALKPILETLSISSNNALSLFAKLQLAELLLSNGLANVAIQKIREIRPQIMTCGSVHIEASLLLLLAKCYVESDPKKSLRLLDLASWRFERSRDRASLRNLHYLKARIYHEVGDVESRNEAASIFRLLSI